MNNRYGMYTDKGNTLVHNIVMTARRSGWDFDTVCRHLVLLSKAHPQDAGEATDTIVREVVYTELGYGQEQAHSFG